MILFFEENKLSIIIELILNLFEKDSLYLYKKIKKKGKGKGKDAIIKRLCIFARQFVK